MFSGDGMSAVACDLVRVSLTASIPCLFGISVYRLAMSTVTT